MNMAIANFVRNEAATVRENIDGFIDTWKANSASFSALRWGDDSWDITGGLFLTGRNNGKIIVYFTSLDSTRSRHKVALSEPLCDFAKAYILYKRAYRAPTCYHGYITALRALEKALVQTIGTSEIERINGSICNIAVSLIKNNRAHVTAYEAARELERLVEFLVEEHFLLSPFQWRSPMRMSTRCTRIGQEGDDYRASKLPSKAALEAIPKCYLLATEPRDVLVTSIAALLCTAPDRISELFSLPVDCEVTQRHNGEMRYGLRWWPEKGGAPMVKWIVPSMVDLTKEAISKIKTVTEPARNVAAWYRMSQKKIFLADDAKHLRSSKIISGIDVAKILGVPPYAGSRWCRHYGLRPYEGCQSSGYPMYYFADVEAAILSHLPRNFPVICQRTGLRYDEALFALRVHETAPQYPTLLPLVTPVTTQLVNMVLGSKLSASVFARFGFAEPDGSPIKVTTHQFRHWLNTLAHRGGMTQIDIAKWSGRRDVRQNAAYNHMTGRELVEMARRMEADDPRMPAPLAELAVKAPVSRDEFMELEFPTAHVTELGFCVHDYTMLPCQRHRDCINCTEHVCVKGDSTKTSHIRHCLEIAEDQLRHAEEAMADGYAGSDRWHDHHSATVQRLRNLIAILDDSAVPEGSLVRVSPGDEFSPMRLAIEERKRIAPNVFSLKAKRLKGGEM
jgi:hypothetical protein